MQSFSQARYCDVFDLEKLFCKNLLKKFTSNTDQDEKYSFLEKYVSPLLRRNVITFTFADLTSCGKLVFFYDYNYFL